MIGSKISSKAPLIYYSYRQVINEDAGSREINAANKITIRKHSDYAADGLEILMYNCALSAEPELCNGIRQTHIVADDERIDFEGKGLSGNGVPLNNLYGCFFDENGKIQVSTAKKNRKYIYHYLNCYRDEHPEVFALDMNHIAEFFRSVYQFLYGMAYDPSNTWFAVRACVLSYYSRKLGWSVCPFPFASEAEWQNMHKVASDPLRIQLLADFEKTLDERFHEAFQYFREGDMTVFHQKLDGMISLLGTYYLLYSTLL